MNFITFHNELKDFPAFSTSDIKKLSGKVYHHRLVEWQKKGYINRIANGVYEFANNEYNEEYLYYLGNKVYFPSYISLESALSFYNIIPESVFQITSVTTKKTSFFNNNNLSLSYRTIKKSLFFGYKIEKINHINFRIAEPEKAVLDFFYLNSEINKNEQFYELRINEYSFADRINIEKLFGYLKLFNNKKLFNRINKLIEFIKNDKY